MSSYSYQVCCFMFTVYGYKACDMYRSWIKQTYNWLDPLILLQIFCLGGRLVFGPDVRSLFLTILLIMIPVVLFSAFVSRRLIEDFQHQLGDYIVVICAVLTAYVSHSSFTDLQLELFHNILPSLPNIDKVFFFYQNEPKYTNKYI